jgi:hypothetical protein
MFLIAILEHGNEIYTYNRCILHLFPLTDEKRSQTERKARRKERLDGKGG